MARIAASPTAITVQPREEVRNGFTLMGNERLLYQWQAEMGSCCFKVNYFAALTDTRLLNREERSKGCCCCCCMQTIFLDSTIFLRDIVEIEEIGHDHPMDPSLCSGCTDSLVEPVKCLQVKGSFGTEKIYGTLEAIKYAQIEIPASTGNHKIVAKQQFWKQ